MVNYRLYLDEYYNRIHICFCGQLIKFLEESAVMVQIWGKQKPPKEKTNVNTKQAILSDARAKGGISAANVKVSCL